MGSEVSDGEVYLSMLHANELAAGVTEGVRGLDCSAAAKVQEPSAALRAQSFALAASLGDRLGNPPPLERVPVDTGSHFDELD